MPRIPVPSDAAARVLFLSDHTCCKCRERGRPVQLHHIDGDPSNNDERNLAVLCLLCHEETQLRGGFGRRLSPELVLQYRDDWVLRVLERRDRADELAALGMAGVDGELPTTADEARDLMVPAERALVAYVGALPAAVASAYETARPGWDSGVAAQLLQATYDLIDAIVQMLVHLSSWFPPNHFDGRPAAEYLSEYVSIRFRWHRALAEPGGLATGGTIVGPTAAMGVLEDVRRAVEEMVTALLFGRGTFDLTHWRQRWRKAGLRPS